nr:unnamed protein product [Ipomoea batatas]
MKASSLEDRGEDSLRLGTNLAIEGITSFTASSAQKSSAQLAKPGTFDSSTNLILLNVSMTLIHPTKHPSAMSKNPILSPPKNFFPLLQLWKAPSNTPKPSSTSPMAAFLASSS